MTKTRTKTRRRRGGYPPGFTLIELVLVILIMAVLAVLASRPFGFISGYRERATIRQFVNTWQFVYQQAVSRGEAYRLVVNLDKNSYSVLREVKGGGTIVRDVDYLKNFRLKSERERRRQKEEEKRLSLEEEFQAEDTRQNQPLETLFIETAFGDPNSPVRLGTPLEFPSFSEPMLLTDDVKFRDVRIYSKRIEEGEASIRCSPQGGSDLAVVHLVAQNKVFSITLNPASGEVKLIPGDAEFEWKFSDTQEEAASEQTQTE